MRKRGQNVFGMSFGMIFSIIIIIATIGVAVYAIIHFMNVNKCAEVGLFYTDLEREMDIAWKSGIYDNTFGDNNALPAGIEEVCFGSLNNLPNTADVNMHQNLSIRYGLDGSNIFLEPADKACDMATRHLRCGNSECMRVDNFFCVNVNSDNKINIRLTNGGVSIVTVSRV